MKLLTGALVVVLASIALISPVSALTPVATTPFPEPSPLIIAAYGVNSEQRAVDFIQIYNNSDELLSLGGWKVAYNTANDSVLATITSLEGLMLPRSHYVIAPQMQTGLKGDGVLAFEPITIPATTKIKSLFLIPPVESIAQSEQPLSTTGGIFKRNLTTTGYSTSTTFTKQDPLVFTTIAADPLYSIPGVPGLRIVEILPHAADCAPNDESYVCGDYVKIQNNTNSVVDASNYRLRTDSSTSEASNAFMLDVVLMPGGYYTVRLKTDGAKMSLTDSGGYVWLEDIFGVVKYYDETMVYYPSASGSDKQGWSWALDGLEIWQWTSTPMPDNSNVITVPSEVLSVAIETECPAGKYRNPDTGRCKNIEEAIATLVACDEGEYRSPETNRCRKIAVASSISLTPCEPDEERNPATNRCRKTASTAVTIEPCPEGQERNPATNRCRAITSSTPATLTDAATTKTGISSYWLGGGVIVAAIGYGIYEWRSELAKLFRKFTPRSK